MGFERSSAFAFSVGGLREDRDSYAKTIAVFPPVGLNENAVDVFEVHDAGLVAHGFDEQWAHSDGFFLSRCLDSDRKGSPIFDAWRLESMKVSAVRSRYRFLDLVFRAGNPEKPNPKTISYAGVRFL
jgi:hypothetical protein